MATSRNWCVTMFKYDISKPFALENVKYAILQEEKCPKTGKCHIQGYLEFDQAIRPGKVKKLLGKTTHVEKRRGSQQQAIDYCKKAETAMGWKFEYGVPVRQGKRHDVDTMFQAFKERESTAKFIEENAKLYKNYGPLLEKHEELIKDEENVTKFREKFMDVTMRPIQELMVHHLEKQNPRQVTWVYDPIGNTGKTWLAQYLHAIKGAAIFTNAKTADIAFGYKGESIIVFDFARCVDGRVNYGVIESLKNGMIFSTKYKSKKKVFEIPKIIIMANFEPEQHNLSEDRWDIIDVTTSRCELGNTNQFA